MSSRLAFFFALLAAAAAAVVDPLAAFGYDASAELSRVDLTGKDGIVKIVLAKGTGAKAAKGQTISAHYVGKLAEDVRACARRAALAAGGRAAGG